MRFRNKPYTTNIHIYLMHQFCLFLFSLGVLEAANWKWNGNEITPNQMNKNRCLFFGFLLASLFFMCVTKFEFSLVSRFRIDFRLLIFRSISFYFYFRLVSNRKLYLRSDFILRPKKYLHEFSDTRSKGLF